VLSYWLGRPLAALCVEELLSGFLNALKLSLFPYISNQEAFDRIAGQQMKHCILTLLATTNTRLSNATQLLLLQTLGLTITPSLNLIEASTFDNVLGWYR
jgi:hypothetical protein